MKTERFELKLSKADKAAFRKAASAAGLSMGSYILQAALMAKKTAAG